jgi:ParB-like chromosome segregation protein Spo0J
MEKKLVRMKLADLVPYDNNPRRNEEAVEATIASMQQCGNIDPIEVDENRVILSGHTRRLALLKMGYEESDVVVVTGLTDAQKKKYRLLANKTNEFAGWDFDKLEKELDGLDFEGFDFGFSFGGSNETLDDLWEDAPETPKEPKQIKCPHCGQWFTP